MFFFNNYLILEIHDGEASEKARAGGLAAAGCRKALGLLLLCCPGCTCRAHTGAAMNHRAWCCAGRASSSKQRGIFLLKVL